MFAAAPIAPTTSLIHTARCVASHANATHKQPSKSTGAAIASTRTTAVDWSTRYHSMMSGFPSVFSGGLVVELTRHSFDVGVAWVKEARVVEGVASLGCVVLSKKRACAGNRVLRRVFTLAGRHT